MDEPEYLTVQQVAKMLQFSSISIYRKLKHGDIPGAQRVGRTWRISRSVLEASFRQPTISAEARQALVQALPLNGH